MILAPVIWFRQLSDAAKEECQRAGNPTVDVEHLFLALMVIGGDAKRILDMHGATLARARAAIERVREGDLASIGVNGPSLAGLASAKVDEPWRTSIEWNENADSLARSSAQTRRPDLVLLERLLRTSRGIISSTVSALRIDSSALVQDVDTALHSPSAEFAPNFPTLEDGLVFSYFAYVPAAQEEVWKLLSDPGRRLEWDPYEYGSVTVGPDGVLETYATETKPGGGRFRVRPGLRRSRHALVDAHELGHIEWLRVFPDESSGRFNQSLRVDLAPEGSGTWVRLSARPNPSPGMFRGIRRRLLAPLVRRGFHENLRSKADAISRTLR